MIKRGLNEVCRAAKDETGLSQRMDHGSNSTSEKDNFHQLTRIREREHARVETIQQESILTEDKSLARDLV